MCVDSQAAQQNAKFCKILVNLIILMEQQLAKIKNFALN